MSDARGRSGMAVQGKTARNALAMAS
jgi:hypothetical protein